MKENIINFYTTLLKSVLVIPDDEGLLSWTMPGASQAPTPCTIGDYRLVLPTDQNLRKGFGKASSRIAFHPISESIILGESDVIKYLKRLIVFRLSFTATTLIKELFKIAANPELHSSLNPDETEFLSRVPEAKPAMVDVIDAVVGKIIGGQKPLINIYLQRNYSLEGKEYRRAAVVNFPIKEELYRDDTSILGVSTSSKKAKRHITAAFEYVLSSLEPETYTTGTDADVAPFMVALLESYYRIAKQLNKITLTFADHLEDAAVLKIPTGWHKHLKHLDDYLDVIPALEGNKGSSEKQTAETNQQVTAVREIKAPTVKKANTIVEDDDDDVILPSAGAKKITVEPITTTVKTTNDDGSVDWGSVMRNRQQAVYQPPVVQQVVYQQPVQQQTNRFMPANIHPAALPQQPVYQYNYGYQQPVQHGYSYQQPVQQGYGYQQPVQQTTRW